ncbi:IS66 family transposase [Desulfomarina profundi]|uniref:IS66 family transposase n=1 Tax=Desulfomarina profundi TaxID=2772557 RepID=A0A8D5FJ88_9BACT|nr:IS66 family transposase [Desulfomarina profundi]
MLETRRSYEKEINLLHEQLRLLRAQMYGKKSEKRTSDNGAVQLPLFDMPEPDIDGADKEDSEEIEVKVHSRKKPGRKKLPVDLPRVEVLHDIPEEDKVCDCGAALHRIGEEVSEKLDIIPAVIRVIRHVRPKYACRSCEGVETEGAVVKIAPPPKQIIDKGIATAGLIAYILTAKFCDALPFYRQEAQFKRIGAEIPRASMCHWAMKIADRCQPLIELLQQEIRSGPLINIDETTVQVLKEPGRSPTTKSYMWVCRGGAPVRPGLLYHYAPNRSSDVARDLLRGYRGVVQSDGYKGYDFLDTESKIVHAACWAHARRKFTDAQKGAQKQKKAGSVDVALGFISKIYRLEREAAKQNLSSSELLAMRQEKTKKVLDNFYKWLGKKAIHVTPKSLLGKAVKYTLGQWERLKVFIDHPQMTPDNNLAENAIRPFVVGRKNWLFAGTVEGAMASAGLYSLIETAKANGLEPYAYLRFLLEKLPFAKTTADYKNLLPMYLSGKDLVIPDVPSGV